jgi:hypothetical protein
MIARWLDYRGRPVELSDEGLAHITRRHPEFRNPVERLQAAVTQLNRVTRDVKLSRAECYYRAIGGRVMVKAVVLFRPTPGDWVGDILTGHMTEREHRNEVQLWP